jgi:hypothetical protein
VPQPYNVLMMRPGMHPDIIRCDNNAALLVQDQNTVAPEGTRVTQIRPHAFGFFSNAVLLITFFLPRLAANSEDS